MELFTSVEAMLPDSSAVRRLVNAGVPVIPVSEMTLGELVPLAADHGLRHAMIVEAGGAIARWKNGAWDVEPCGPPSDALLDAIGAIEERSGARLIVYSALQPSEAGQLSGKSGAMLDASLERTYSEPFLIESGDPEAVRRAAAELGFSIRRGNRFLHLIRASEDGAAFARVRDELQCHLTVAIGSALLDAPFLLRADLPFIVPAPGGELDSELLLHVPHARVATNGWAAAVDEVWQSV